MSVPEISLKSSEIFCPGHYNITCPENNNSDTNYNLFLGPWPTYVSLVSCSFSSLGAISLILTYILFKDLRSGSRSIITYLSIADLLTALGYIVGDINYLLHYTKKGPCQHYQDVCIIQSYITVWSQLSSYVWNCMLALYLFLTISLAKNRLANKLIPVCQVIAWGFPILIALPLLLYDHLGYSPYSASNWCFIKDVTYQRNHWLETGVTVPIMIARVIPELLTYIFIIVIYSIIKYFIMRMKRKLKGEKRRGGLLEYSLQRVDTKLLMIPLFFILLRVWGLVQLFLILVSSKQYNFKCVGEGVHNAHKVLGIMEAIGEGGQGWANALLFIVFNAKTRHLIYTNICKCYYLKRNTSLMEKLAAQQEEDSEVSLTNTATIDDTNSTGLHEVGAESFRNTQPSIQID